MHIVWDIFRILTYHQKDLGAFNILGVPSYSQIHYEFNMTHDTIAIKSKELMDYEC